MRSETPESKGAVTPPVVSTAGEHGSSVAVLPAEFPTLDQTTICFPHHNEFYDKNAIDEIEQAANRSVGEWLAFMGLCWGDADA